MAKARGFTRILINHADSTASMKLDQGDNRFLERTVVVLGRLVAVGDGAHANDAHQRRSLNP
jgi:hypothetical protein